MDPYLWFPTPPAGVGSPPPPPPPPFPHPPPGSNCTVSTFMSSHSYFIIIPSFAFVLMITVGCCVYQKFIAWLKAFCRGNRTSRRSCAAAPPPCPDASGADIIPSLVPHQGVVEIQII